MSEVSALEDQLKAAKQLADKETALVRLKSNKDFRKIIMEGFCLEDSARYMVMAGDNLLDQNDRNDALNMAMAAGHLQRFLKIEELKANGAAEEVLRIQAELELARSEERD